MKTNLISLAFILASSCLIQPLLATDYVASTTTNPCTSPAAFQYDTNATLIALGTFGTGSSYSLGSGTRMMWYSKIAAFRAGYVSSTQWDLANMGNYSAAFGRSTTASGAYTFAAGNGSSAGGMYATAFGTNTSASGQASTALGYSTLASGVESVAGGYFCQSTNQYAVSMGSHCYANGVCSVALGFFTTSNANACTAVGRYNLGLGDTSTPLSTDPLFEVGNGSATVHSNAFTVYMNGSAQAQGPITAAPGGDIPMFDGY